MKKAVQLFFALLIMAGVTALPETVLAQDTTDDVTVTLTEYSDYQCPACAYFHPIVEKLKEHFGDQLELDLRYYPLNSHQFAALAARAAQAADNQGKFYEMHSMLFENQGRWSNAANPTSLFVNYAREIGLDVDKFQEDLNASQTQEIVMEQKKEGVDRGVRATPTFYIDGKQVQNLPRTYEAFERLIQQYINGQG